MPDNFPPKLQFGPTLYHPAWNRLNAQITRWLKIYNGGDSAKGELIRFSKETQNEYINRQKVTAFPKLCARVLNVYNAHLFADAPDRTNLPEKLLPYVTNIDGDGTNIDTLLSQAYGDIALPASMVYFLVTATANDDGVETRADEKASGRRPLVVPYDPRDLLKWDFDDRGQLKYIVLKDARRESDSWDSKHVELDLLRIWTPTEWVVYKKNQSSVKDSPGSDEYEWDSQGQHPIGEVPLVPCYNIRKTRFEGESEMSTLGLADLNVDIYNKRSWLDQGLEFQGFPIAVRKQPGLPEEKRNPEMVWGPGMLMDLFGENDDFNIVETSGSALGLMQKEIDSRVREFLDTGFRRISISTPSAQKEASEAKRMDLGQFEASLREKATNVDEAERNIWRFMSLWDGVKLTPEQAENCVFRNIDLDPDQVRAELKDLLALYTSDAISHDTLLEQCIEQGYLTESVDPEEERDKIDLDLVAAAERGVTQATATAATMQ